MLPRVPLESETPRSDSKAHETGVPRSVFFFFLFFLQNREMRLKCIIAWDVPIRVMGNSGDQKLCSNVRRKKEHQRSTPWTIPTTLSGA